MIVQTAQLTEIFDVSARTVANWHKSGCPRYGYGKWDLKEVIAWWAENIYTGSHDEGGKIRSIKEDYWTHKARNEKVKADLAEAKTMPVADLKKAWAWRVNEISTGLGQIPFRLAPMLVDKPEKEIRSILDIEVWKMRDRFSRTGKFCPDEKKKPSKPRKTKRTVKKQK